MMRTFRALRELCRRLIQRHRMRFLTAIGLPVALVLVMAGTAGCETRPNLSVGARGSYVTTLQQRLIALHYDLGSASGVFESQTQHAVVAFQKVNGLGRDGVVGPATWAKLDRPDVPRPRLPMTLSTLEVDLTRQVVYLTYLGTVTSIIDASSGSGQLYWSGGWQQAITPVGNFHVYSTFNGWQYGSLGPLYRPAYFIAGFAVHGSPSVPPAPASHGCVRVTVPSMDRLWPFIWYGMPVSLYY
jgi:N-acetylmuramoyl-L-alanine amidase